MIPTNNLRFVERDEIVDEQHPTHAVTRTVRILQQFWEHPNGKDAAGEWRDVPVEKEHG
jgi:hypothetical protein